jgi:hypothetical protein
VVCWVIIAMSNNNLEGRGKFSLLLAFHNENFEATLSHVLTFFTRVNKRQENLLSNI